MKQPIITVPAPRLSGIDIDRIVICDSIVIDRFGNLIQRTECHFVLATGETFQQASQNPAYSEGDRFAYGRLAAPIVVVTETSNSFVNPSGELVGPDIDGNYPPDAIAQTDYMHMIPVSAVGGTLSTPVFELIKRQAEFEIHRSISRNLYGGYVAPAEPNA